MFTFKLFLKNGNYNYLLSIRTFACFIFTFTTNFFANICLFCWHFWFLLLCIIFIMLYLCCLLGIVCKIFKKKMDWPACFVLFSPYLTIARPLKIAYLPIHQTHTVLYWYISKNKKAMMAIIVNVVILQWRPRCSAPVARTSTRTHTKTLIRRSGNSLAKLMPATLQSRP